jgi:hypothetical protein
VARAHDWDTLVRGIATTLAGDLGLVLPRDGAPPHRPGDEPLPSGHRPDPMAAAASGPRWRAW